MTASPNGSASASVNSDAPSSSRWRVYLRLGRVSNLPTVWSNCVAGVVLAGAVPEAWSLWPLLGALTLFYTGGMFLNDAFDHPFDREFRPERPIPMGEIPAGEVYGVGFALMAMGEALLALPALAAGEAPDPWVMGGGVVLALLIVYYNYRHKTDPLSPLVMALCRGMVYIIAAAVAGAPFHPPVWLGIAIMLGYLIGLTYAAKQENLQEVKNLWPLLFLAAPFAYALPLLPRLAWESLFYPLFLAWVLYAVSFLLRREGRNIPRAVISLIAGISLLDGMLMAQAGGGGLWPLLGVAGFALTLFFQRFVPGT